jgi:iron(III) transport system permease protein
MALNPSGRWPLLLLLLLVALLALLPVAGLAPFALLSGLGPGDGDALAHTAGLVLLVGLGGAVLGTATGWLTAACRFPGRRLLRIAQLLPLAAPPYLLAATLIDSGSRLGLRLHGDLWAAAVLTLITGWDYLRAGLSLAQGETPPSDDAPAKPPGQS